MQIINSLKSRMIRLPVYGAGADIYPGTLMMPGVTGETDLGVLIGCTAASNADAIGVLQELHDYSVNGDALVAGSACWFAPFGKAANEYPAKEVELLDGHTLVRVDYDLTSDMAIGTVAGAVITVASIEDGIDTGFLYINDGTGVGQLEFIASDDGTLLTVATAFATTPVAADSTLVKVLPLFHQKIVWTASSATAPTKVGTTGTYGTGRGMILERHIVRNGMDEMLDPHTHGGLTGLSSLAQFKLYNVMQITNSGLHPID